MRRENPTNGVPMTDPAIQNAETIAAPIAAYDFDGTITRCDTLFPFLRLARGRTAFWWGLARAVPAILAMGLGRADRSMTKERTLRLIAGSMDRDAVETAAERFASTVLPRLIRPGATAQIAAEHRAGYAVVVVSASPEPLVAACVRPLNADLCIGTRLAWDDTGTLAGFDGANCHGAEKVRRLRAAIPDAEARLARAYGDTPGDRPMMALAAASTYRPFRAPADRLVGLLIFLRWIL